MREPRIVAVKRLYRGTLRGMKYSSSGADLVMRDLMKDDK